MVTKRNFTDGLINRVVPPEGESRIVIRDAKMPGLVCRISSSGVKTFSFYRRINGSAPERITIGRFPAVSVKEARKQAAKINGAIADGKNPANVKRILRAELTFEDLFYEFLEKHSKVKKRTWKSDISLYRLYLKGTIGKVKLSHVTRAQVRTIFLDATSKIKKLSNGELHYVSGMTANRVLALMKTVFNWGIAMELCDTNPTIGIKKNAEKSRTRFLQADELPRFFKALENEENDVVRDYILISLLTGARRSNVLQMRWDQIVFNRQEWIIPRTKNDDPQTVVLCREAMKVLMLRKATSVSDYVFPGDGKLGYFNDPKKGWKRLLQRANIEDLRLHDLRRTLGSWQAKTGASLIVIGKSLGHKSLQATAVYARLDLEPVRQSVETATMAMMVKAKQKEIASIFNRVAKNQVKPLTFFQLLS